MSGEGFIALDVVLFMAVVAACLAHVAQLHKYWWGPRHLYTGNILKLTGWLCFSARFGHVLLTQGDLLIPLPSEFALLFLAAGDLKGVLSRRKVHPP